jgi:nitric oxide dioxygenase
MSSLEPKTIALVKASIPALATNGADITSAMYRRLFEDAPIKALFNPSHQGENGAQVNALAAAILGYARNIDNLGVLGPVVERIAQKHIGYHILPEHYPFVARALLGAIQEVLGDQATPEILEAWGQAFWFLADILQAREQAIREEIAAAGGWVGWRQFRVTGKIAESSVITSFILEPIDNRGVIAHKAGQYLTIRLDNPDFPGLKRNYSISCAPNTTGYRISVKREDAGQGGSRYLHQHVAVGTVLEATPPAGEFFLPENPERPVLLLSGGVGLTPMVSMVETIAARHPALEAHYVHGALNSDTHAMDRHVRGLAQEHGRISVATFYSAPAANDKAGDTHDHDGFITAEWLSHNTPLHEADIYVCGPKPFLRHIIGGLTRAGVAKDRIHFEFFGPADEDIAA